MSYTASVNNTPSTGAVAMYSLISTLVIAGWTMPDAGDASTRAANQITTGASGGGGLGNTNSWVRLKAPTVNGGNVVNQQRELTIQRGTTDVLWRVKYSASAGFTGGSPSATVTPSATDEVFMFGGGTDGVGATFLTVLPTNGTYKFHTMAGGANEFYSFACWWLTSASTTVLGLMAMDVMATGSFPATDVDPAVTWFSNVSSPVSALIINNSGTTATNPAITRAWLGATSAAGAAITGTNSQYVLPLTHNSNGSATFINNTVSMGTNPFTNKDDIIPMAWARPGAVAPPTGWKGYSTLFAWGSVQRTSMDTCDVATTKDRVYVNGLWLPWSGATPSI